MADEIKVPVVAVGGPGDGHRYIVSEKTRNVRIFSDGPMRGNLVPGAIHALPGTYVDYDLAEFGIQGDASVFLLKPVGSTLVNIMTLLTQGYHGLAFETQIGTGRDLG